MSGGCAAGLLEPVDASAFYKNLLRPALEAVGLPGKPTGDKGRPSGARGKTPRPSPYGGDPVAFE